MFQRLRWSIRARFLKERKIRVPTTRGEFVLNARSWQIAPLVCQYAKGGELQYEKEESERFLNLIEQGDVVFDIGGQVGYYTLLALQGGAGHVCVFEISKAYRKEIRRQLRLAGEKNKVEIVAAALGERDGKEVMFQDYFGKTKMPGCTIDTFCKERNISPNVIKIDVQGNEVDILKGMRETMRTQKPKMMVMLYEALLRKKGQSKEEGLEILRGAGYAIEQFANEHSYICLPKT